ncbi:MAG TPA: hypothetical protein VHB79_37905 [Polyangiaceae bacterium]|nr:hypothetical protein [Polyangiaceae bacterium]
MRFLRLLVAALCLATLGLLTAPAQALGLGTVTISAAPIWLDRSQADRKLDVINRRDCLDDAKITFTATIANAPGGAFEVWSGAGCDAYTARSGTSPTCVKVFTGITNATQTVTVRVQSIIRPTSEDFSNPAAGTAATCDAINSTSQASRALFFIDYNVGDNSSLITSTPKWAFKYDTIGPAPPTGITADSGERSLNPRFTAPTGETNIIKYHFYCAPAAETAQNTAGTSGGGTDTGGSAGTAGTDAITSGTTGMGGAADMTSTAGTDTGGTAGTAGTDTGGTAGTAGTDTASAGAAETSAGGDSGTAVSDDSTCRAEGDQLVPGEDPPQGLVECGSVTATGATKGHTNDSLENNVRYAVAIAAEDDANNIGKLSKLACGVPAEVTGFFEAYTAAGGQAGGGFCSFAPARRGSAAMALLMLLGTCALVARRRR